MKTNAKNTAEAKPPVAKLRIGLLTASIWERAADAATFHSVTFERRADCADSVRPARTRQR